MREKINGKRQHPDTEITTIGIPFDATQLELVVLNFYNCLGEGKMIYELKLANDSLRWKLQQRDRALQENCSELFSLKERQANHDLEIKAKNEEITVKDHEFFF